MRRVDGRSDRFSIELLAEQEQRIVRLGAKIGDMSPLLAHLKFARPLKKSLLDIRAEYNLSGPFVHRNFTTLNKNSSHKNNTEDSRFASVYVPDTLAPLVINAVGIVTELDQLSAIIGRVSRSKAQEMLVGYWDSIGHGNN